MINIKNYFKVSDVFKTYNEEFTSPDFLIDNFLDLSIEEQKSILNHYIVNGRAAGLKAMPLLYDQIISYMADIANVPVSHITIVGSFKLGFCSGTDYGRVFSSNSDIDMTIFDEHLFEILTQEFKAWKYAFEKNECKPHNERERECWHDNVRILSSKIGQGFIDTYKLPNRTICPTIKNLNNAAYLIKYKLEEYHNYITKGVSIRVYNTYDNFISTLLYNTKNIIRNNKQ